MNKLLEVTKERSAKLFLVLIITVHNVLINKLASNKDVKKMGKARVER